MLERSHSLKLKILDVLPRVFLTGSFGDILEDLEGPTWINIKGEKSQPLFISTLLHGDETTGVLALQRFLKSYFVNGKDLPRDLCLFIGNVPAAKKKQRFIDDQLDWNRVWSGDGGQPEFQLAKEVLELLQQKNPFACVDIHNTSGKNPPYACISKTDSASLRLAEIFRGPLVYFTHPKVVLLLAMSKFAPSILLECGQSHESAGIERCLQFLESLIQVENWKDLKPNTQDLKIYRSFARVMVSKEHSIRFENQMGGSDFSFLAHIDQMNFVEQPENELLGWRKDEFSKLIVLDENKQDISGKCIRYQGHEIRLNQAAIPAMFTTNERAVHQDCLGYLMHPFEL